MMVFISLARIFSGWRSKQVFSWKKPQPSVNAVLFMELWIHLSFSSGPWGARLSLSSAELRWRQVQVSWFFLKFCNAVKVAMASSAALRESSSVSVSEMDSVRVFYLWWFCPYITFCHIWPLSFLVRSEALLTSFSIVTKNCELLFEPQPPCF